MSLQLAVPCRYQYFRLAMDSIHNLALVRCYDLLLALQL
jgi:hypothetical protein